ncbi:UV radiation resistance protein and autophagy-related subunit 14-domain-containing protein [Parasitella parasitica]|nr:UV radiation resistance protein and autophagy-related subunit 14-domain-containing protein [Parasitella parasitica]
MADTKVSLEPRQKRIRHLQSIAARNIVWKTIQDHDQDDSLWPSSASSMKRSESTTSINTATAVEDSSLMKRAYQKSEHAYSLGLLDAYFTLSTGNICQPAFYKSEMIPNTLNPTFRSLPCPFDWMNWYDTASSTLIIRLWTRHSIPESAGQHTEPVLGYADDDDDDDDDADDGFQLLVEWQVDLNALVWIGKSMQLKFPENTLLVELDDGFYSAPDIKTFTTTGQSKRSSLLGTDCSQAETCSIHTVSSMHRNKRSYTYNNIIKLNTFIDCIFDTQTSSNEIKQNIQDILDQEDRGFRLSRELNQHKANLIEKEYKLMQQKKLMVQKRESIKQKKREIDARKTDLLDSVQRHDEGLNDLQENELVLEKNIKMRQNMFHTLSRRKKELIADLFSIYPIEQSYDDSQQFRIRGIYLPNSVYDGQNDEMIATALGFTAHLVSMLAYYLEIPLRYPTTPMSSRSTIADLVSLISGSREFPLYAKGVDRYRFEFGVFLLNKNIEQLMNAYGLIVIDLRHTLPNIHYFIQAILTTSVTSKPTSMSVLSISSYANGGHATNDENGAIRQDHNHLTLQPNALPQPPSPSISTQSINTFTHSPKSSISYPSAKFLNTPQTLAAPALLDAITTSSSSHSTF